MSVLSFLTRLASETVISKAEQSSISTSIATLEARLFQHFGPNEIGPSIRFGSSTRGTILPRLIDERSDVDYMIMFKGGVNLRSPQTYLNRLRDFVGKSYAASSVRQSSPTIVLELNHIQFDLVPVTPHWWDGIQIPNRTGGWMHTNPTGFNATLERMNRGHSSLIKPTIRLMKYWNVSSGRPFESFETEKFVCSLQLNHLPNLREYLFAVIGELSAWNVGAQWIKAEIGRAKAIVANVKMYEEKGQMKLAEDEIKKLFRR